MCPTSTKDLRRGFLTISIEHQAAFIDHNVRSGILNEFISTFKGITSAQGHSPGDKAAKCEGKEERRPGETDIIGVDHHILHTKTLLDGIKRDEPNVGHAVSVGAARSRPMQVSLRENGGHTRPGGDIHVQDIRHGHNGQSCGRLLRGRTRQMSERARLRPGDEFTRARGTEWAWMNPRVRRGDSSTLAKEKRDTAVATEDIIGMSWHSLTVSNKIL
ncbi:hypothetical protein RIB2604_00400270 [Aspergillus luchuensis]|uniref:Uncharacterized protein n=1 Tax=Aspergillus kawachii TaxID=1069201 RepID=A0A146EYL5_ASPKA|nr:hypothetical protein RIB2604_00400270 [Aspergillus luchuensis]